MHDLNKMGPWGLGDLSNNLVGLIQTPPPNATPWGHALSLLQDLMDVSVQIA